MSKTDKTAEIAALRGMIEDLEDRLLIAQRRHEPTIPAELAFALAEGEAHPLRLWREHRGLSLRALAEQAEVSASMLSEIETGRREGRLSVIRRLADALDVSLDDVVLPEPRARAVHDRPRRSKATAATATATA